MLSRIQVDTVVQAGAGKEAGLPDQLYTEQNAQIAKSREELFDSADIVMQVHGPGANAEAGKSDVALLKPGQVLIALLDPLNAVESTRELAETGVTAFAQEMVPRISRAQSMDALTSQATIVGVFVVGAGVAGLQAIATAHRLGAVVQGYDIRPAVKDQVESLGAKFVQLELDTGEAEATGGYAQAMGEEFYKRQRELLSNVVADSDVVITTAAVPGRKAPILITEEMVKAMNPGSVIVDVAAEGGGNCELTKPAETVEQYNVTIMGPTNLASSIPLHASQMYARNQLSFLRNIVKDGDLNLDMSDQITRDSLLTHNGEVVNNRVREMLGMSPLDDEAMKEGSES
ncbi:NAD(P) transhydrogenase subunit alpha part 1 [Geodia barretti]|uniref:proton-translocating NAD(P)(+) transhydrogenase n=1 Tax=Geodia barretti TaxID=519541 RepID=A0AA35SZE6_GEOBA|nr:NAD(P) transhydrogenase subunit alpha part 1 [Geodia barretti]